MSPGTTIIWSWGGLAGRDLLVRVIHRCIAHKIADRAALLSFYFLVALFPLLTVLLNVIGFLIASEADTYVELLNYLDRTMPHSAFTLLLEALKQLASKTSGGKVSLGVVASLWTASSGVMAMVEALNVAFEVPRARSWWHRRLIAILLTLSLGGLQLWAKSETETMGRHFARRSSCKGVLAISFLRVTDLSPDFHAVEPLVWIAGRRDGSSLVAVCFQAALVVGGEFNAVIWHATSDRS